MRSGEQNSLSRACVVSVAGFETLAHSIERSLQDLGLQSRVGRPTGEDVAIVLLLSHELPEGLAEIAELPGRIVPVQVGDVPTEHLPERVASINWIPWTPQRSAAAIEDIGRAAITDLDTFFLLQSLEARAAGWESSGRSKGDLVRSRIELRQLLGPLDLDVEVTPAASEFIRLSKVATRAATRGAWVQRIVWTGLSIAIVLATLQAAATLNRYAERRLLYQLASAPSEGVMPVSQVPKFTALVMLSDEAGEPAPFDAEARLARLLSEPGPIQAYMATPNQQMFASTAFGADGRLLQVGTDGRLWAGVVGRSETEHVATVPHRGYLLAADMSLQTWAVADHTQLTVARSGHLSTVTPDVGDAVESLRMQRDGAALVALGMSAAEVYSVADGLQLVRSVPGVKSASEVRGRLVLVVTDGDLIRVEDAASGDLLTAVRVPDEVGAATVLADGSLVVVAAQQLWRGQGEALVSVGYPVPGNVTHLEATSGDEVLLASFADGARLVDVARGVRLADVCREGYPQTMNVSVDARHVACGYGGAGWIWDLESVRPSGPGVDVPGSTEVTSDATTVRSVGGALEISRGLQTAYRDVVVDAAGDQNSTVDEFVSGSVTAVALLNGGETIAYGTDAGEVVVADLTPSLNLLVTQRWRDPAAAQVQSLQLGAGRLDVGTGYATWRLRPCTECLIDRATLLRTRAERQLPCYPTNFDSLFPARISQEMAIAVCEGW